MKLRIVGEINIIVEFKDSFKRYRLDHNEIVYGIMFNPNDCIRLQKDTLYMDLTEILIECGKTDERDIRELLSDKYDTEKISAAVRNMIDVGLIDTIDGHSTGLEPMELQRTQSNRYYFEHNFKTHRAIELQELIHDSKICILGIGGIGSNILYQMAALGCKNFTIVDGDTVELSNLNRQLLFSMSDVGSYKTVAAIRRIKEFIPDISINSVSSFINGVEMIRALIRGHDLVFSCFDEPREFATRWVNEACVSEKIPYIVGGLAPANHGGLFCYVPDQTACFECHRIETMIAYSSNGEETVNPNWDPFNISTIGNVSLIVGSMINDAMEILLTKTPFSAGRWVQIDFNQMTWNSQRTWNRMPSCDICNRAGNYPPGSIIRESGICLNPFISNSINETETLVKLVEPSRDGIEMILDGDGLQVIKMLGDGKRISEVQTELELTTGFELDVISFVEELLACGFVKSVIEPTFEEVNAE